MAPKDIQRTPYGQVMKHHDPTTSAKVEVREERCVQHAPKATRKGDEKEHTFQELEALEKRRRAVLQQGEKDFYSVLFHVDGTVISFLFKDTIFWLTCVIYIVVRMVCRYGSVPAFVSELGRGNIALIGGFISFFLVLFVNKSHDRYFGLYRISMAAKGQIMDLAAIAKTYMEPRKAKRLVRYLNAAHVAGYTGLSKTYPASTFFSKLNHDFGLLTDEEYKRMKEIDLDMGASCSRELLVWCQDIIKSSSDLVDPATSNLLRGSVMQLRSNIDKLFDDADLPIPFFYVHFIFLLTFTYLPLYAISTALGAGIGNDTFWTADVVAGLVLVLQAIFITGLRVLGQRMSNPYGDDLIDLSVMHFVTYTWMMSNRVLATKKNVEPTEEQELELEAKQISIGDAWEEKREASIDHTFTESSSSGNHFANGEDKV